MLTYNYISQVLIYLGMWSFYRCCIYQSDSEKCYLSEWKQMGQNNGNSSQYYSGIANWQ